MTIKAVLFDISGVLYEDGLPLPGAITTVRQLQNDAVPMRFVTNTSRSTSQSILAKLNGMGFRVTEQQIFTAPLAVKQICKQYGYRPYCLIHPDLASEFTDLDQTDPNAVLVADAGNNFDYQHLNRAFSILMQGAPLLGIGLNRYFKSQGELQLDAGPFIKALEYASGVEAFIVGKPAKAFFNAAVQSLNVDADEVLMIGDDVEADVGGALNAGLHACLVKTGKYLAGDESKIEVADVHVADSVADAASRFFYHEDKGGRQHAGF